MAGTGLGRDFWRFWTAAAAVNLGDGIRLAAFPLLAASLTEEPLGVAAVSAAQFLPWLVTGLAAGSLADRRPVRALLAGADTGRVAVLAVLAVAVAAGLATVPLVAAAAFLLGVAETVRDTAAQSAVPGLVPERLLERANGRLVAGEVVANEFVGPPVGAALFVVGAALPFTVNGASTALAVMLVLSLPLRRVPAGAGQPVARGVRAGLRWLARHRELRALALVVAAVAAADAGWFSVLVLYARERLDLGALGFGGLLATGAAGGVLGALLAERLLSGRRHRAVIGWAVAVTGAVPVLLVAAPGTTAAVAVVVLTSAGFGVLNVAAVSLRHRLTPRELLGRVTAASRTVGQAGMAVGAVLGGGLASVAGLDAPFVLSGCLAVLAAGGWWTASRPRRL